MQYWYKVTGDGRDQFFKSRAEAYAKYPHTGQRTGGGTSIIIKRVKR